jgi:LPS-assembly protein
MRTKNRKNLLIIFFLIFFAFNFDLSAEEFNITANEILIDKENEILVGEGSVKAVDSEGKVISADKITYKKLRKFLLAEGRVKITDIEGNILTTDRATYDKISEIITTYDNTELVLREGYKLITKNISYDTRKKILSSNSNSIFIDNDGNKIETSMFQYHIADNLFSSVGKIKIIDIKKNKYFLKELYVDTKKNEMIGSDVSVILDQENFGVSKESDPRFVANDIFISKYKTDLSKGVFTVCKKRDGKCPPWTLKAKKITHDKVKKTIYYDHATLKLYDIPIFYFPKFFHPDPTVKRQSGFLAPFFTNSTTVGTGFALPYYWAISDNKDLTFSPKIYTKENVLFLNEYRQAFRNGFLTLDTSYTEGYKNTSSTKTDGSRNHIFADFNLNFNQDESYQSNLHLKIQRTSNDTYFKKHDINTALVDSENTNLENEIKYSFSNDDTSFDLAATVYEDLSVDKKSDKYEYILPNIMYGKTFFTEKFGTLNFTSNALYSKFDTNKNKTFLTNDIIWSPSSYITKKGFMNSFEGMIRNTNYEARKTKEYKNEGTVNELSTVLTYKSSLPLQKDGINYSNFFSPNFMLRYAPGHMRNLSNKDVYLRYTNLYSMNKTSEIEDGLSAILGFDFKINEKVSNESNKEKFSLSLGQVFNFDENKDIPSKSSLDQKMSDVVGEINYNFSKIGKIDYKFSIDHNLNELNYNEVSTELNFGKVQFNLDYLEQQNHIGLEHYVSSGVSLNFNDNNKFTFSTKKNFKTESTELYNLSYQYAIDCLTAGLAYRREFYQDADLEPKNTLMFTITFVPFTSVNTPLRN